MASKTAALQVTKVSERNVFYRDIAVKMIKAVIFLSVVLILSAGLNLTQFLMRPQPDYFAITPDGRLIPIRPLSDPLVAPERVLDFAQQVAQASFIFDFQNYRAQFSDLLRRQFYTKAGFESFKSAIEQSTLLEKVRSKKLVVSAVVPASPVITKEWREGGENGRIYKWRVEMPLNLTLQGQEQSAGSMELVLALVVERVPLVDAPAGIGVSQIIAIPKR